AMGLYMSYLTLFYLFSDWAERARPQVADGRAKRADLALRVVQAKNRIPSVARGSCNAPAVLVWRAHVFRSSSRRNGLRMKGGSESACLRFTSQAILGPCVCAPTS